MVACLSRRTLGVLFAATAIFACGAPKFTVADNGGGGSDAGAEAAADGGTVSDGGSAQIVCGVGPNAICTGSGAVCCVPRNGGVNPTCGTSDTCPNTSQRPAVLHCTRKADCSGTDVCCLTDRNNQVTSSCTAPDQCNVQNGDVVMCAGTDSVCAALGMSCQPFDQWGFPPDTFKACKP